MQKANSDMIKIYSYLNHMIENNTYEYYKSMLNIQAKTYQFIAAFHFKVKFIGKSSFVMMIGIRERYFLIQHL